MMRIHRFILPAASALALCFAQEHPVPPTDNGLAAQTGAAASQKAPPEVEEALRTRVNNYYEDCIAGKYREAENLLAEESRDYFYNHNKPKYRGFEVQSIQWSQDFQQAKVFVLLTVDMPLGSVTIPGHPTMEGDWKLVDGQWYLHLITPQEKFVTPFGTVIKLDPEPAPGSPEADKAVASRFSPASIRARAADILHGVKPDHDTVVFDSAKPGEAIVHVSNGTPSIAGLELVDPHMTGLSVAIDKTRLSPTEQATLTVRWKPRDAIAKPSAFIHLRTIPAGQDIAIRVDFSFNASQARN